MKLKVTLLRTVQVPTQELVWTLFGDVGKPVQRTDIYVAFREKFSPVVKGIKFFWNFNHTKQLPEETTVGIEVMNFDIREAERVQEGLIEADFLDQDDVLRREGALLSELERIGIFLIRDTNPFGWRIYYAIEGN